MLPGIDGISTVKTIRIQQNPILIFILSARNSSSDVCFPEKGADLISE
jgi:DNA-binding response OmpR family regulator